MISFKGNDNGHVNWAKESISSDWSRYGKNQVKNTGSCLILDVNLMPSNDYCLNWTITSNVSNKIHERRQNLYLLIKYLTLQKMTWITVYRDEMLCRGKKNGMSHQKSSRSHAEITIRNILLKLNNSSKIMTVLMFVITHLSKFNFWIY